MFPFQQQIPASLFVQQVLRDPGDGKLHLDDSKVAPVAVEIAVDLSKKYLHGDGQIEKQLVEVMRVALLNQQGNLWHL